MCVTRRGGSSPKAYSRQCREGERRMRMGGVPCAWLCQLSTEVTVWMCPLYAAEWLFPQLLSLSGARGSILVKGKQAAVHCKSIGHGGLCLIYTLPFRLGPHSAMLWRDSPLQLPSRPILQAVLPQPVAAASMNGSGGGVRISARANRQSAT